MYIHYSFSYNEYWHIQNYVILKLIYNNDFYVPYRTVRIKNLVLKNYIKSNNLDLYVRAYTYIYTVLVWLFTSLFINTSTLCGTSLRNTKKTLYFEASHFGLAKWPLTIRKSFRRRNEGTKVSFKFNFLSTMGLVLENLLLLLDLRRIRPQDDF